MTRCVPSNASLFRQLHDRFNSVLVLSLLANTMSLLSQPSFYYLHFIYHHWCTVNYFCTTSSLSIRDMYYRHKAAGMLNSRSVGRALARAEWRFIVISSLLFCVVFIPISGIANSSSHTLRQKVRESFAFWGFFTFNVAIYSYIGMLTGVLLCYSMHSISSLTAIFTCFAVTLYRPAFHVFGQGTRYSSNFG